jgi:hypothetical protein
VLLNTNFLKILLRAVKQKSMKLEIIHLCEYGSSLKSKTGRWYGLTSVILLMILKNKEKNIVVTKPKVINTLFIL